MAVKTLISFFITVWGKMYGQGYGCGGIGAVAPRSEGFAPSDLLQQVAHLSRVLEARC